MHRLKLNCNIDQSQLLVLCNNDSVREIFSIRVRNWWYFVNLRNICTVWICSENVDKKLTALGDNRVMGPDQIHPTRRYTFCCSINIKLLKGIIPSYWFTTICPIFKKGECVNSESTVLSVSHLPFAKYINVDWKMKYRVRAKSHHGLMQQRSCLTHLYLTEEQATHLLLI